VDTVAHRTALDSGVYTIAVLGTGLDVIYPAANAGLFTEIRKNGALMTELMPGARPARSFFPTRNRIIAAMAETVIVVQAAAGSGSMITANWAARLGRNVMTILPPSGKENTVAWEGNRILLNSGARPVLPG
ncbi:MAG TPA: DNA-processing protein DprA, partial [Candidatus Rifleibacterium sp.]|nr:DNA-processing protein DprA [Candidatus Rifleibacterium sp.]